MQRYLQWTRAANDEPIPAELRRALSAWQWSKKPNAGSHDPKNLDSHSLPRTLAVALFLRRDAERAIDLAADVSRTTQQAPIVLDLCRVWAGQFIDALSGVAKAELAPATDLQCNGCDSARSSRRCRRVLDSIRCCRRGYERCAPRDSGRVSAASRRRTPFETRCCTSRRRSALRRLRRRSAVRCAVRTTEWTRSRSNGAAHHRRSGPALTRAIIC